MRHHSKVCRTVQELIAVLTTLRPIEYTAQFNLDGTWTIHYQTPKFR
ncbi:hypothetical protein LLE49_12745 [Alicyclobacillus tolerans]|nr:hypothetical protein [Alicyclobacillus tolerans]MCF8565586.1 hypothetical protein [Alicyclobacillus tolerans]